MYMQKWKWRMNKDILRTTMADGVDVNVGRVCAYVLGSCRKIFVNK